MSYDPFTDRFVVTTGDQAIADSLLPGVISTVQDAIAANEPNPITNLSFDVPCPGATNAALMLLMRGTCKLGLSVFRGPDTEEGDPQLHFAKGGPLPDPAYNQGDPVVDQAIADALAPGLKSSLDTWAAGASSTLLLPCPGASGGAMMQLMCGLGGTDTDSYGIRGAGWKCGRGMNKPGVGPQIQVWR